MAKPEHVKAHETKSHDERAQKPKEKQQKVSYSNSRENYLNKKKHTIIILHSCQV